MTRASSPAYELVEGRGTIGSLGLWVKGRFLDPKLDPKTIAGQSPWGAYGMGGGPSPLAGRKTKTKLINKQKASETKRKTKPKRRPNVT